jgi:hypothetical protein
MVVNGIPPLGGAWFPDHFFISIFIILYLLCSVGDVRTAEVCLRKAVSPLHPGNSKTVDRAADCHHHTGGNADLGKRMSVVSRCCRRHFPKPLVGAVYRNGAERVRL